MASKRQMPESRMDLPEIPSYFDISAFLLMQQRNVETMVEANRIFVETAQAIARCQTDMMKDCVEQVTRALSELGSRGEPSEIATRETAAVQALFEKTAGHVRTMAELLGKSNADAIRLVNGRMQSLMEERRAARESSAAAN